MGTKKLRGPSLKSLSLLRTKGQRKKTARVWDPFSLSLTPSLIHHETVRKTLKMVAYDGPYADLCPLGVRFLKLCKNCAC